ncbi:MAG: prolyl-tRNA synthetase associated domain-containing protein [Alphaproteobacteria bacterium]|nr:prolyl-tRNA synthetase associated domain-containing protein [Alphaproteobacteria bacterium]
MPHSDNNPPPIERPLRALFAELGIETVTHRHVALATVAQSQSLRGSLPGGHIKNLFLRDKKRRQWLVTVDEDRTVDLKELRAKLGTTGNLSFGSPELLQASLGIAPGAVTPFAAMNDHDRAVTFVLDRDLMRHETINAHPLHNEATVAIACDDLLRFLDKCGHPPLMVDFA